MSDLEDRNRLRALIEQLSILASYDANTLSGPHFWQPVYQHLDEARAIAAGHVPAILPEDGLTYLARALDEWEDRYGR